MTARFNLVRRRTLSSSIVAAVGLLLLVSAVGVFVIDAEGATPEPVPFDETIRTGMTAENQQILRAQNATVPRAEIFYSQYQFVVGYTGVRHMIDELQQPRITQQYGRPIAVYVTDYAGTAPSITAEGYPRTENDAGWVRASDAAFVVDSDARTPSGEVILPFSSKAAASAFADEYGGNILDWREVQTREVGVNNAEVVREQVATKHATADERVKNIRPPVEKEQSLVVGEDASTIQAAIEQAKTGTNIRIPPGTYEETLRVDKPVTLHGMNATVRGDGNGSVIKITSSNVAIQGLSIEGVGTSTEPEEGEVDNEEWDSSVEAGYGHSDAAIEAENVSRVYINDVKIETPTSGVLLRDVSGTVIEDSRINGHENQRKGFMGVLSIRSPIVVQNTKFNDGRDGIYIHRADGSIIRNNTFLENRFGVHLMYTSDTLIANNVARRMTSAGVTIMTDPSKNAVVGNDIRNSSSGLEITGSFTYIAENTIANNGRGIMTGSEQSLYERNVIFGNSLGVRSGSIRPSNRIVRNDFIDNEDTVMTGTGPLRIWTHDGRGNYWSKRPAGINTKSYAPTATLDTSLHDTGGARALSASPAATALTTVRDTVAGTRSGGVLDTAPRSVPVRPRTIDNLEQSYSD